MTVIRDKGVVHTLFGIGGNRGDRDHQRHERDQPQRAPLLGLAKDGQEREDLGDVPREPGSAG
jgi:hypothetical protein